MINNSLSSLPWLPGCLELLLSLDDHLPSHVFLGFLGVSGHKPFSTQTGQFQANQEGFDYKIHACL